MRAGARKVAFHLLFEQEFGTHQEHESALLSELCQNEKATSTEDIAFVNQLVALVTTNKKEIKKTILGHLVGYTFDRIHRVDSVALMLAVAELMYTPETGKKIVINEAVNLAKEFGGEKSTSFVNGVLASIVKE